MSTTANLAGTAAELPPLVLPESSHYDDARRAWNPGADLPPAAVCVATNVRQIHAALAYALDGTWLVAHASPRAGSDQVVIVIEPARAAEIAPTVIKACG